MMWMFWIMMVGVAIVVLAIGALGIVLYKTGKSGDQDLWMP